MIGEDSCGFGIVFGGLVLNYIYLFEVKKCVFIDRICP